MIGKHESGLCDRCQEEETVEHVVLKCRDYEAQREVLRECLRKEGLHDFTLSGLLSMRKWVQVKAILNYLRETGVLNRV